MLYNMENGSKSKITNKIHTNFIKKICDLGHAVQIFVHPINKGHSIGCM